MNRPRLSFRSIAASLGIAALLALSVPAAHPALAQSDPGLKIGAAAPEFTGLKGWLNGGPMTLSQLRGKVVLVDFWAYSCINCIRTLPFLEKWQREYGPKGLQVIGVHTPEFKFETNPDNITAAIKRFGINYPVAEDSDRATWDAYSNEYWPAEYLIDQQGHVVRTHFGEGEYDQTENAIRKLLGISGNVGAENGQDLSHIGSPEMYFGLARVEDLASPETPHQGTQAYTLPATLPLNHFALSGQWTLSAEHATLATPGGRVVLHARSGKIFMVASADHPITVGVAVDGKTLAPVTVRESKLYTLFDSTDYGEHTLELDIPQAGFSAFTFTFG